MTAEEYLCRDMMAMTELIADAVIKRISPVDDDLSQREAISKYGNQWLRDMERRQLAHPHRIGNRKVYSRHELDTLRAIERQQAQLVKTRHNYD